MMRPRSQVVFLDLFAPVDCVMLLIIAFTVVSAGLYSIRQAYRSVLSCLDVAFRSRIDVQAQIANAELPY